MDQDQTQHSVPAAGAQKEVVVYSTPTCTYCKAAKEFFHAHNVAFTEVDVAADAEKRKEMMDISGQLGVPVIRIGNDVVVGFDKDQIADLLAIKN